MSDKFKNKYRIQTTRLQNWDYGRNGTYLVTLCTQDREWYFGEVMHGEMKLSETGKIAMKFWQEIPDHFPFVKLDAFVIMPDHIHGIVVINKSPEETQNLASPSKSISGPKNKFGPQSKNLASVIRGFKTGVTLYARNHDIGFAWQPRYHDQIIRNGAVLRSMRKYIMNNPKR